MTNQKLNKIIEEIKYFLFYYEINIDLNNLDKYINNFNDTLEAIVVNYFYSTIDDTGRIVSLEMNGFTNDIYINNRNSFFSYISKYKKPLVFLDVDNTLTYNGFLSEEKKEYISNFKHKNQIILSTGKVYESIKNTIEDCNLEENYFSTLNGSVLIKNNEFEILNGLGSLSNKIIMELKKYNLNIIAYYKNSIIKITDLIEDNYYNLEKYNEMFFDESLEVRYDEIIKILIFINDDNREESKEKENIIKEICTKYSDIYCCRTAYHTYEILKKNVHKGLSLKKIAEELGYYYRNTIAVGDSMNDFEMLNYAGMPYVVSNQSNELKEYNFNILEGNRDIDIIELIKNTFSEVIYEKN